MPIEHVESAEQKALKESHNNEYNKIQVRQMSQM